MDVVDFLENICGAKLYDWQKQYLRLLYDLSRKGDVKIVMDRDGHVFTYVKQKELTQNGKTNACK